jgi:signal transduction histidine kinase
MTSAPARSNGVGLAEALHEHAALINSHDGSPEVSIDVEGLRTVPVSPVVADAAYRIITEALTNVLRHSGAKSCSVSASADTSLRLQVTDDGRGLGDSREGTGRISMRERASGLGGSCRIEQGPAGGTVLRVELPLRQPTGLGPAVDAREGTVP